MHIVLSLLVGCYLMIVWQNVWADRLLPTAVVIDPPAVPMVLRAYMTGMGICAYGAFCFDLYRWMTFNRRVQVQTIKAEQAQVS
jgi:hypothetical protein